MEVNDFVDKYGDIAVVFGENNDDPQYDYEAVFSVTGEDKTKNNISISYKRDDEFTLDQLFKEVLDKFDEHFTNINTEGYVSDFVYVEDKESGKR